MTGEEVNKASSPTSIVGYVSEIGNDENGDARIVIHTTHEAIKQFAGNLVYADVEVRMLGSQTTGK